MSSSLTAMATRSSSSEMASAKPQDHIVFFPYPQENCKTKKSVNGKDQVVNWVWGWLEDPKTGSVFSIDGFWFMYDGSGKFARNAKHYKQILGALEKKHTLYICGHCEAGASDLSSPDEKVSLTIDALLEVLSPLPKEFAGRIKCYGCESARDSGWWVLKSQSFAKRLFDGLRKAGYTNVQVFGYTHNIGSEPRVYKGKEEMGAHKYNDAGERSRLYLQQIQ